MRNRPFLYQLALFYLTAFYLDSCSGQTTTYYLDDYPIKERKTISLSYDFSDSSIILKSSAKRYYPSDARYYFAIEIPNEDFNRYRIHGTVQNFHFRHDDRLLITSENGPFNNVIYDSKRSVNIPISFYSKMYDKVLIFELQIAGHEQSTEFEITLTTARYCFASLGRKSDEYFCSNDYCIKDKLTCNDRDNCGNNNDEQRRLCSKASIIGYAIGGVLLFVALVTGCVIVCRRKDRPLTILRSTTAVIIPSRSNIYPSSQVPVPNSSPPETYVYNTNRAHWQQFPDHPDTPPPPYPGLKNQSLNPNYPQNTQRY